MSKQLEWTTAALKHRSISTGETQTLQGCKRSLTERKTDLKQNYINIWSHSEHDFS